VRTDRYGATLGVFRSSYAESKTSATIKGEVKGIPEKGRDPGNGHFHRENMGTRWEHMGNW